jgi:hypothetical protein
VRQRRRFGRISLHCEDWQRKYNSIALKGNSFTDATVGSRFTAKHIQSKYQVGDTGLDCYWAAFRTARAALCLVYLLAFRFAPLAWWPSSASQ